MTCKLPARHCRTKRTHWPARRRLRLLPRNFTPGLSRGGSGSFMESTPQPKPGEIWIVPTLFYVRIVERFGDEMSICEVDCGGVQAGDRKVLCNSHMTKLFDAPGEKSKTSQIDAAIFRPKPGQECIEAELARQLLQESPVTVNPKEDGFYARAEHPPECPASSGKPVCTCGSNRC